MKNYSTKEEVIIDVKENRKQVTDLFIASNKSPFQKPKKVPLRNVIRKLELNGAALTNKLTGKQKETSKSVFFKTAVLAVLIILAETGIMFFLENFTRIPKSWILILDPTLLTIILLPFFYLLIYNPFKNKVIELESTSDELNNTIKELSDYKYALDESSIVNMADENGKITYVNDNFCKISKYNRDELMGQEHRVLNSGYHSKEFIKNLWDTIKSGNVWRNDVRDKAKDGTWFWVDTTIIPLLKENGKPYKYMVVRSDISNRKESDERLKSSESRLSEAQEIARMGSWNIDFETGKGKWSDESCRIFGIPVSDNVQTFESWLSFIHPDDLDYVNERINESNTTLTDLKINHRICLKDGTIKHIYSESKFEFDKDGEPKGLHGIAHDVTDAMMAERKLELSESTLKKAQEIAHIGSWKTDLETNISEWSDEQCRIFGLEPHENQQTLESLFSFIHPDDREFVIGEIKKSLDNFENNSFYYRIVRRDGTIRNVYASFKYEVNKAGKPLNRYGITHDVTERIKSEEALLLNNTELKKINAELDRFVYSISHELRSPLTSVMGLFRVMNKENLEDENKQVLNLIDRSVNKMDETLKEILDYSRNARGELRNESIDFKAIIDGAFENTGYYKEEFRFDKRINIKELVPSYSDALRIKIIMNNLISNALKYARKDNTAFIDVNIKADAEKLTIQIADNGIGIKAEHIPHIFGMFYRATVVSSGSGLGLYIVKECTNKLNGTINVESEFGKGTKFTIEIPKNKHEIN